MLRVISALSRIASPFALALLLAGGAWAASSQNFTFGSRGYADSRERQYTVYVPDGLSGAAPLVMALHGCEQVRDNVLDEWGLKAAADTHGFILVAPFITSYSGLRNTNCWGFWFDAQRHQGAGEVEDLHQLAREVESRFAIDPARRYILGLSSGAAMAVDAAVAHNEYWAAAASASGLPYGEEAQSVSLAGCFGSPRFHAVSRVAGDMRAEVDDPYVIPLMVLQNNADCTVRQPAGRNIRDAHLAAFGDNAHDTPAEALAEEHACTPVFRQAYGCRHSRYTVDGSTTGRSIVETVFYDGPLDTAEPSDTNHGHYWIGGEQGREGRWAVRSGPSYPDIVWDFFDRHPRDGGTPPVGVPQVMLVGEGVLRIALGTAFVDPGATASDTEDGELPVSADCSAVDTATVGSYTCTYSATDRDGNTGTARRTVDVFDPDVPTLGCASVIATPAAHIVAGRARAGGFFGWRAITTGDARDIGFSFNGWLTVTLHEGEPGLWYVDRPAACSAIRE